MSLKAVGQLNSWFTDLVCVRSTQNFLMTEEPCEVSFIQSLLVAFVNSLALTLIKANFLKMKSGLVSFL